MQGNLLGVSFLLSLELYVTRTTGKKPQLFKEDIHWSARCDSALTWRPGQKISHKYRRKEGGTQKHDCTQSFETNVNSFALHKSGIYVIMLTLEQNKCFLSGWGCIQGIEGLNHRLHLLLKNKTSTTRWSPTCAILLFVSHRQKCFYLLMLKWIM